MPLRLLLVPFQLDWPANRHTDRAASLWLRAAVAELIGAALVLFFILFPAVPALAQQFEGRTVRQVSIPGIQPADEKRLIELLPLKAGEPYTAAKVRDSIQRLYATRRFVDIQVDAVPSGDGVALTFLNTVNYFIGGVFVEGIPIPPTEAQQVAATRLELGAEYTHEKEDAALAGLKRLMADNGWYQPRIQPRLDQYRETQLVDVHFEVIPGDRAKIADVQVTGSPGYDLARIKHEAGLKPGKELDAKRIPNALNRLQHFYQKNHYLEAKIAVAEQRFIAAENRVLLVLSITRGPQVDVRVSGARMSSGKKRELIPIYQEGTVDPDLVREGEDSIRNHFQQHGRFEAEVTAKVNQVTPDQVLVEYQVTPGPKHAVALVDIQGHHYFSTETLRERMYVARKSLLSRGRYSPEYLKRDMEAIRSLYVTNGFAHVNVTSKAQDNYQGKKGQIAIFLGIEEGQQTLVRDFKIEIEGAPQVSKEEIANRAAEAQGQPYSDANVLLDRDTILGYYFNEGFRQADMAVAVIPVPGTTDRVDIIYRITEGNRRYVDEVVVSGIENTRRHIVDHQITIRPGNPISQSTMLETQQRLYDLGVFQGADVAVQNQQGREPHKNVLIQVTEGRRWTLQVGGGADIARFGGTTSDVSASQGKAGFSPRVSFDVTRLNVFGRAQTISLKTALSTLQKRALFSYEMPRLLSNPNLTALFNVYYDQRFDVQTFASTREEGSVALEQRLGKTDRLVYSYAYRRVTATRNTELVSVDLIPLFERPVRIAMLSTAFVRDRRDDPVDTKRGRYITLDMGVAARQMGGQASFTRGVFRYSTYHPIGRTLVFARSTQFGAIRPFGPFGAVTVTQPDGRQTTEFTREVPLPERFFAGGGNSHRGFGVNQAGPRDPLTGFPIGGNALFINNLELRFPLRGPNLGGAVFHDLGNVYSTTGNVSFRFNQKDPSDFDYAVQALGFGVRYKTPIGPMRLDLAYSINPPRYFGVSGTTAPANGCVPGPSGAVPSVCKLQQLHHFQFFFSIGQTF